MLNEGIQNKQKYLNNEYLKLGATSHSWQRYFFPNSIALFTGQNLPQCGSLEETVEIIYDRDILDLRKDGSYTGM